MSAKNNKKSNNRAVETDKMLVFIEDLCWLLDSNKNIDFKKASTAIKELMRLNVSNAFDSNNAVQNEAMSHLIGILPTLLKDETLFPSNSRINQFATQVLQLEISRWEKRSRFEIIGLIVCSVEETNQDRLATLTDWITKLLENKERVREIQKENNENAFSWNIAIQKIISDKNE